MATNVLMPALSPTMTEGRLARWLKHEGDAVAPGDVLAEIETDKATMEVEAVDEGTLGRILVSDGTDGVAVNTPIAVLLAEGETPEEAAAPADAPEPEARASPSAAPGPVPAAGPPAPEPPACADPAPRAEPDRRVFASPLARRLAREADLALTRIAGSGPNGRIIRRDVEAALAGAGGSPAPAAGAGPAPAAAAGERAATQAPAPEARAPEAPATRAPPVAPSPALPPGTPHRAVPNSPMRRAIARRLSESVRERPHFTVTVEVELDALASLRARLNAKSAPEGRPGAFRISVNDMLVKACGVALRRVPGIAVTWTDEAILHHERIDVSVAVAVPDGLITPILRDVDGKGLAALSLEARELFARARDGRLRPEEYQGGGFSISNLGMFGVRAFTAIINPPQSAILAVGGAERRPVVRGDRIEIASVMTATLSSDHRAIDGALAARFLAAFRQIVEDPVELML